MKEGRREITSKPNTHTVLVEVEELEESVKVGVKVFLHDLLEEAGQPDSVSIVHQTVIVHPHHLARDD